MNKNNKNLALSNYSLTTQIIIINIFTAVIGSIVLLFINFVLLSNNNNIDSQIKDITTDLNQISNFLSKNSIIKIPEFNVESCKEDSINDNSECGSVSNFSKPQLDPTLTQKYLLDNYLYGRYKVKIYDNSLIKFADTEDIFISEDVIEVDKKLDLSNLDIFITGDSDEKYNNKEDKNTLYYNYKINYLKLFNFLQKNYNNRALSKIGNYKNDILLVQETIKKNNNVLYLYKDDNFNTNLVISKPILLDNKIYGVVVISSLLDSENNDDAIISFNLINLFIIIIFIMFILSILFSQSIISPIKVLSKIVRNERDKSNKHFEKSKYPQRLDEIGILSKDIKNMSEDLKKHIEEIESFAADVSHELKNPLASLKSSNDLLIDNKINNDKKSLLLKNMKTDIQRMNNLITDISNYTLTQVEMSDELFYNFNLVDFLKNFLDNYPQNSKNISIKYKFDKEPVIVHANKDKLAQIFINLIENSISFSPQNSEIFIEQKIHDKMIVVILIDQGPGIPQNLSNKIFERFYTERVNNQTAHTGLGLSIAKKIVESFYGTIKLSKSGTKQYLGACFQIKLPLKE